MMKKILGIIAFVAALLLTSLSAQAVPAKPGIHDFIQPNGDTLQVRLIGDEHFHYQTTADGYLVAKNKKGYLCYALWEEQTNEQGKTAKTAKATKRVAKNEADRSHYEKRWLIRKKIAKREVPAPSTSTTKKPLF